MQPRRSAFRHERVLARSRLKALLRALLVILPGIAQATDIAIPDLRERLAAGEAPVILDVRTPEESAAGHVPGAVNIPVDDLPARIAEVPASRDAEVLVYCRSGRRAQTAMETLAAQGRPQAV